MSSFTQGIVGQNRRVIWCLGSFNTTAIYSTGGKKKSLSHEDPVFVATCRLTDFFFRARPWFLNAHTGVTTLVYQNIFEHFPLLQPKIYTSIYFEVYTAVDFSIKLVQF